MAVKLFKYQNRRAGTIWSEAENCFIGWRVDFRFNGRRHRNKCFPTVKEAEQFIKGVKAGKADLFEIADSKMCSKCGIEKELAEFSVDRRLKDGRRSSCKICDRARENQPEVRARKNAYQREKGREWYKKYRNTEKGKTSYHRYKQSETHRRYKESEQYLSYMRNHAQKRNAAKKQLPYTLTETDWQRAIEYFNYRCVYCGMKRKLEQEHFIPISKQGGYTPDNIVPACKACNIRKSNNKPEKWCSPKTYERIQKYFQTLK